MPTKIPHRDEYVKYFDGAIQQGVLHKVPIMHNPGDPKLVVVGACGHASHNHNRYTHLWERVTTLTQLYCQNGGGVVYDPIYGSMNGDHDLFHRAAIGQILGFVDLALADGTIQAGAELPVYPVFDVPCKVITALDWSPQEFVESSIRAKTYLKSLNHRGVTFKVGLLYFLGEPIHSPGQTWYASRCDMVRYTNAYNAVREGRALNEAAR